MRTTTWEQLPLFQEPDFSVGETAYERENESDEPADQYWIDRAGAAEEDLEAANVLIEELTDEIKLLSDDLREAREETVKYFKLHRAAREAAGQFTAVLNERNEEIERLLLKITHLQDALRNAGVDGR